jgi:beta-lysine 5,6-aminomutase alpha subunit
MSSRRAPLLDLDPTVIQTARRLAEKAGAPVVQLATTHTTVSVERALLRLAGLTGADPERVPWVTTSSTPSDQVGSSTGRPAGVGRAASREARRPADLAQARRTVRFTLPARTRPDARRPPPASVAAGIAIDRPPASANAWCAASAIPRAAPGST